MLFFAYGKNFFAHSARNTSGIDFIYFIDSNHQSVCTVETEKGTFLTCVVFLCVTVTHEKDISPIWFAWNRIVDTSLGIGISLAVNSFPFHKFKVGGTMGKY